MVKILRFATVILLFAVAVETMGIRTALTLYLGLLGSMTADCQDESNQLCDSYEMETERELSYKLEQIDPTTLESNIYKLNPHDRVLIPKTEGCSAACRKLTRYYNTDEIVCSATADGASFSVNYTDCGEPQNEKSPLVCSMTEAGHGESEIKCDAAQGDNFVSVTIDLKSPSVLQCNIYYVIDFGVFVTCSSSLFTIDGIAYFINKKPVGVVQDSQLHISWDAFPCCSSKLSLSVSVSNGELYHIHYTVETPSRCDEVEISEYHDLRDKFILTTRSTGNSLEIVDVTLFKDDKAISENSGSDITVPKDLLSSGEDKFIVFFTVTCCERHFLLVRQLTVTLSPECHANCRAHVSGRNLDVGCQSSCDIKSITYSINEKETKVIGSQFVIEDYETLSGDQLLIIVNTIHFEKGGKSIVKIGCYKLDLECLVEASPCTQHEGVSINCTSNVPASSLTIHCSIDGVPLQECDLDTFLSFSQLHDNGLHNFNIRVTDSFSKNAENKISFPVAFIIWCAAEYKSQKSSITVSCDSTRPIFSSVLQINGRAKIPCSLPCTISMTEYMSPTQDITIAVEAHDQLGNLATHDNLHFSKIVK